MTEKINASVKTPANGKLPTISIETTHNFNIDEDRGEVPKTITKDQIHVNIFNKNHHEQLADGQSQNLSTKQANLGTKCINQPKMSFLENSRFQVSF
jgi:hypothetical protein